MDKLLTPVTPKNPADKSERAFLPEALRDVDRTARALELRRRGYSFTEIAKTCGFRSETATANAIKNALERTIQEPAEELRTLESMRLDVALKAIWDEVIAGSLDHIKVMILIMERRAKLLGLDTPPKQTGITLNFIDMAMQAAKAIDYVPTAGEVNSLTEWATSNVDMLKTIPTSDTPVRVPTSPPNDTYERVNPTVAIYKVVQQLSGIDTDTLLNGINEDDK